MVRRANQDSAMANGSLFAVADGMGGHRGGEVASGIAAGHFRIIERVSNVAELEAAVVSANEMIRARAAVDADLTGMGTTIVALGVLSEGQPDSQLQIGAINVGDSRLYVHEVGILSQVSVDHSLVAELARAGRLTEEEALRHPQRNVVTRALGAEANVKVDSWVLTARLGQRYLMCSDGLVNEVSDSIVERVLSEHEDPEAAAQQLVDLANQSGGRDNITVLIVDVVDAEQFDPDVSPCDPAETTS
jgi:serine/threonine protein phosphatase PrpC